MIIPTFPHSCFELNALNCLPITAIPLNWHILPGPNYIRPFQSLVAMLIYKHMNIVP